MSGQFAVVCSKCQIPPELVTDSDGPSEAVCSSCGARDDANDAMRIAGEHFLQETIPDVQKGMARAVRSNEFVFAAKPIPKRSFKWHSKVL